MEDPRKTRGFSQSGYERDFFARNMGEGKYKDISGVSGLDRDVDGRAAVYADFDNDGDIDIFLVARNSRFRAVNEVDQLLYLNQVGNQRSFLRVHLEGTESGRDAFGAIVRVKLAGGIQTQIKAGGSGFLSQHDPRLFFGLGVHERVEWLEVKWPSGALERFEDLPAGEVKIVEGEKAPTKPRLPVVSFPEKEAASATAQVSLLKVGDALPDLPLRDLSGKAFDLHEGLSKTGLTLISFWATWCRSCRGELQDLATLARKHAREDLEIMGVNIDPPDESRTRAFLSELGVAYPSFHISRKDLSRVMDPLQGSLPHALLVDRDKNLVAVFEGWSSEHRRRLASFLSKESP